MQINVSLIEKALGHTLAPAATTNAKQVLSAYNTYGAAVGLDKPHRAAQYFAQILCESNGFKYDKEVWGPTPAQQRYDTRTDLGNTAEADGDGFLFRGRTGIQITGRENYGRFRDWCRRNVSAGAPDFVANPDMTLGDPWEGLGPIWFWDTHGLNALADRGDNENISRRINGGRNGLDLRLALYTRMAMVLLGFGPLAIRDFQAGAKAEGIYEGNVDGDDGPLTRSALHRALAKLSDSVVTAAPVVETKTEVVVPPALDKPVTETFGFWERLAQIAGLAGTAGLGALFQDWKTVLALCGGLAALSVLGLILHSRIIGAVKDIKEQLKS